jgi:2-polyprenyl-3-methyl-5-hydroxy-6-metoxy-1,4-benzoquinol methylase
MQIHYDLPHVVQHVKQRQKVAVDDFEAQFKKELKRIEKFKPIDANTKILEVGSGMGWFPILCKKYGIACKGIDICPELVEYAQLLGQKCGVVPDIELGNIEAMDLGISTYDIVIALSTFEHVEHWQKGIQNIFRVLKPGGLFYFYSTNKFSFVSGEYRFPFYGWLPNRWRYSLQKRRVGQNIMKLGVDFNQFNHFQLKRFFTNLGFSKLYHQYEVLALDNLIAASPWKKIVLRMMRFEPMTFVGLCFSPGTLFVCIK